MWPKHKPTSRKPIPTVCPLSWAPWHVWTQFLPSLTILSANISVPLARMPPLGLLWLGTSSGAQYTPTGALPFREPFHTENLIWSLQHCEVGVEGWETQVQDLKDGFRNPLCKLPTLRCYPRWLGMAPWGKLRASTKAPELTPASSMYSWEKRPGVVDGLPLSSHDRVSGISEAPILAFKLTNSCVWWPEFSRTQIC